MWVKTHRSCRVENAVSIYCQWRLFACSCGRAASLSISNLNKHLNFLYKASSPALSSTNVSCWILDPFKPVHQFKQHKLPFQIWIARLFLKSNRVSVGRTHVEGCAVMLGVRVTSPSDFLYIPGLCTRQVFCHWRNGTQKAGLTGAGGRFTTWNGPLTKEKCVFFLSLCFLYSSVAGAATQYILCQLSFLADARRPVVKV